KKLTLNIRSWGLLCFYMALAKLTRRRWGWLDQDIYRGKRVIVIGPAESSLRYMSGEEIDRFDIIVRVNKSPLSLAGKESSLGSRTDILYHCCNEDPITGGGPIKPRLLKQQKVQKVIYTYGDKSILYDFFKAVFKYP